MLWEAFGAQDDKAMDTTIKTDKNAKIFFNFSSSIQE
jgi:hypothetical protein